MDGSWTGEWAYPLSDQGQDSADNDADTRIAKLQVSESPTNTPNAVSLLKYRSDSLRLAERYTRTHLHIQQLIYHVT